MSTIQAPSLLNTKWTITETKGNFSPFTIHFEANGQAPVHSVNGKFSGVFTWDEQAGKGFQAQGNYSGDPGEVYDLIGSVENGAGAGNYTVKNQKGKVTQVGKFTMSAIQ